MGDFGERRPDPDRPQRSVSEHQHLRVPRRDGQSARERVRERPVRGPVFHAVVQSNGEAVHPLASHGAFETAEQDQGSPVRTAARRPTRGADGQVLQSHSKGVQTER